MKIKNFITKFFKKIFIYLVIPFFALTASFKGANYEYLKGKISHTSESKDEISIIQWNVCLAGSHSKSAGGVENSDERLDNIIKNIEEADADIVVLQEAYDNSSAKEIFEKLQDKYANIYMEIGSEASTKKGSFIAKFNPYYKSGLMILSKHEINNPEFHSFSNIEGAQSIVNKGVFVWDSVINDKIFSFAATHLNPSEDDNQPTKEEMEVRKKEISFIYNILNQKTADYQFLFGDMNIDKQKEEFASFGDRKFDLVELKGKDHPTNATEVLKEEKENSSVFKFDYPLQFKKSMFSLYSQYQVLNQGFDLKNKSKSLSDHHPTLTIIALNEKKAIYVSFIKALNNVSSITRTVSSISKL